MKAIILAAGKGTRMYPLTVTTPKLLLPILNETLLDHFVTILDGYVDEIVLVISEAGMADKIRKYIDEKQYKIKFTFVYQEKQLGTGHALQCAKNEIKKGEDFLMMYGDDLYSRETIDEVMKYPLAATAFKVKDPEKWGIHKKDEYGNLVELVEKPQEFIGDAANTGLYRLNYRMFELFRETEISPRGEYELTDGVTLLAKESEVKSIDTINYWIPVGYPWHLLDAQEKMIGRSDFKVEGTVEDAVTIKGNLKLGEGSIIKSGTYIEGDVVIGKNCIIGPNVYLEGPVSIGDNCDIEYGVGIKRSIFMEGTRTAHLNYIADGVVGKNVGIGAGTVTANMNFDDSNVKVQINGKDTDTLRKKFSTVVGDNVKIGVNVSIHPGKKVWPNSIILPGEIVSRDIVN